MPTSGTYTYFPPDGPPGPVTPIPRDHVLIGQPGLYGISADRMLFISAQQDQVLFAPGSNRDAVALLAGGNVSLNGNFNAVVAQSGQLYVDDAQAGDIGNAVAVGRGVSMLDVVLQPTDQVFLMGAMQADIDAAFASLKEHPQPGYYETLSIPRGGGAPLSVVLPTRHNVLPAAAQFHAA